MATHGYRICTRCIMDNISDPEIEFDADGVCNHCKRYDRQARNVIRTGDEAGLNKLLDKIKKGGRKKKYDCVLGMSGGVDSTYVAYLSKQFGLRPLAVHYDNGWNYEVSVRNIKHACEVLGIDLHTHVQDWEEFKDLQLAFIKASVVDIEMITDHAILGVLFRLASQEGVKYIVSGSNVVTEGGVIVRRICHDKNDLTHIKAIQKQFGTRKLRTFPGLGFWGILYYYGIKRIRYVSPLNYVPYDREEAKRTLMREIGFQDYGSKHHESSWTRFYQTYILPRKFNFDKRRAHFSTLINSGQMTREAALEEIRKPPCTEEMLNADKALVLSKFNLTEEEFEEIMDAPVKQHEDYKIGRVWVTLRSIHRWLRERGKA